MQKLKLNVEERINTGKIYANKIRNRGYIPAVVYGHNQETKQLQVKAKELHRVIGRHGHQVMVSLVLKDNIIPVIIKEVQSDLVKGKVLHVDFQQLSKNEPIKMSIPIVLNGKQKIESSDVIVQQQLMELEIQCLPQYIPEKIVADVTMLKKGQSLVVGDLEIVKDENIEVLNDNEEIIAVLATTSKLASTEQEESNDLLNDLLNK